jgi:AcrR family transcriptional regulator
MSPEPTTRQRIVAAAVSLFAEQGFDATSVNQVVQRAAVAKGALYHHFSSKDDLLYEVYRELVERQLAGLQAIVARDLDPAVNLRLIIADLVTTTAAKVAEATVFFREGHRLSDENQQRARHARRLIHDSVIDLVRHAQHTGQFSLVASPEMVAFTVFGVINELPVWYQPDGARSPADIAAELSDLVLAALQMPTAGTADQQSPSTPSTAKERTPL